MLSNDTVNVDSFLNVPTVGIDFGVTSATVGEIPARISFYDLSGAPEYKEVREEFYADTQGVLLIFDVSSSSTFKSLEDWLLESGLDSTKVCFAVCGNKIDTAKREVTEADARLWAESRGLLYFETSAQSGAGITEMFEVVFKNVLAAAKGSLVINQLPKFSQKDIDVINEAQNAKTDHERLGVSKYASKEDINKAYRTMAGLLHPDKNRAPGSEDAFKILAASRTTMLMKLG